MRQWVNRMVFREIAYGTDEYVLECSLRDEVLRKPLGLSIRHEDLNLEGKQFHFGLFENTGELIGCVVAVPGQSGAAKIRQMAVRPSRQGQGHGRELMTAVEKDLSQRGFRRLVLHARASAVGFYQKLGYAVTGDEFIEVSIPHFKMEKVI